MAYTVSPSLKRWFEAGLALLYPDNCQLCGVVRATAAEGYVCASCRFRPGGLRFIRPPFCARCGLPYEGQITTAFECGNCREIELHFSTARAAVVATDLVLEVIHRYKYQRAMWFEMFLGDLLVRQAAADLRHEGWNMVVPVPLHPVKQREREFNQAERLARYLASASGLELNSRLVRRVKSTRTQTLLDRSERAANMRDAFAPRRQAKLHGEKVVLVDDVLTTGATTSACARALKALGASDVCVWTVARGL